MSWRSGGGQLEPFRQFVTRRAREFRVGAESCGELTRSNRQVGSNGMPLACPRGWSRPGGGAELFVPSKVMSDQHQASWLRPAHCLVVLFGRFGTRRFGRRPFQVTPQQSLQRLAQLGTMTSGGCSCPPQGQPFGLMAVNPVAAPSGASGVLVLPFYPAADAELSCVRRVV